MVGSALVLIALLGAELACRALGEPFEHAALLREVDALRRENHRLGRKLAARRQPDAASTAELHPFLGFETARGRLQLELEIEAMRDPRDETYDVLVLGGRIASRVAELGGDAWTDCAVRVDKPIHVWNYARDGFKQPQPLEMLLYLTTLRVRPDAVVSIGGPSDVALGALNHKAGAHPSYPWHALWQPLLAAPLGDRESIDLLVAAAVAHEDVERRCASILDSPWDRIALIGRARRRALERACVARDLAARDLSDKRAADRTEVLIGGPRLDVVAQRRLHESVEIWLRATRALDAVCRQRSIRVLHVIEPSALGARGASPHDARLLEDSHRVVRAAAATLTEMGVDVLDPRTEAEALEVPSGNLPRALEQLTTAIGEWLVRDE